MSDSRIYSRGYLPHWDVKGAIQFLTWHLDDALDPSYWESWRRSGNDPNAMREAWRKIERHLDRGIGSACLRSPAISRLVMESFMEGHSIYYRVHAAVVMPNHVHAVVEIGSKSSLAEVAKQIKGASARKVNRVLGRTGRLWQPDYFDRLIRSEQHLNRCIGYTHW